MNDTSSERRVKIAFEISREDGSCEVETLWAVPVESGYCLDNIPFYATGVAWGDIVRAIPDDDGQLRYRKLVTPSGHSTIRLWFARAQDVQGVRDALRVLGCGSELDLGRLVAVDVPTVVDYYRIVSFLREKEELGVLEFEEGCIGHGGLGPDLD